jgi:hypothetical protein
MIGKEYCNWKQERRLRLPRDLLAARTREAATKRDTTIPDYRIAELAGHQADYCSNNPTRLEIPAPT